MNDLQRHMKAALAAGDAEFEAARLIYVTETLDDYDYDYDAGEQIRNAKQIIEDSRDSLLQVDSPEDVFEIFKNIFNSGSEASDVADDPAIVSLISAYLRGVSLNLDRSCDAFRLPFLRDCIRVTYAEAMHGAVDASSDFDMLVETLRNQDKEGLKALSAEFWKGVRDVEDENGVVDAINSFLDTYEGDHSWAARVCRNIIWRFRNLFREDYPPFAKALDERQDILQWPDNTPNL